MCGPIVKQIRLARELGDCVADARESCAGDSTDVAGAQVVVHQPGFVDPARSYPGVLQFFDVYAGVIA